MQRPRYRPALRCIDENVLHIEIAVDAIGADGVPRYDAYAGLHIYALHGERIGCLDVGGIGTVAGGIDIRGAEQYRVPCQGQGHPGRDAPGYPGLDTVRGVGTETEIVTTDCAPVTGAAFPVKVGQRESHGAEGISHRQVHLLVGGRRKIDRTPGGHRKIPGSQCQRGLKAHARFPDTAPYIAAHEVGATRNFHTALPILRTEVDGKHYRHGG